MTIELLDQYVDLQREYRRLVADIKAMRGSHERVRSSMVDYPHIEMTVPVVTHPSERTLALLMEREKDLANKLESIQEFINSVDDSRVRQIIDLRIVKRQTWLQTAFAMGWTDEQRPRKYLKYYIDKRYGRNRRTKGDKMIV